MLAFGAKKHINNVQGVMHNGARTVRLGRACIWVNPLTHIIKATKLGHPLRQ